jgi:rare lipoprotein A
MSTIATHSHWPLGPALLASAVLSAICISPGSTLAQPDSPHADAQTAVAANPHHRHWIQFGRASWYGRPFQGQPTASGELFDMNSLTCAHRSLPIGASVLVTNLRNHRSVLVRVNDRGPVLESRVIDLSYAAAKILGFRGVAPVRLDLVDPSLSPAQIAELSWPAQFQR